MMIYINVIIDHCVCSEKVIMLLSAGESSDDKSTITQSISDGRTQVGKVAILSFGLNVHGKHSFFRVMFEKPTVCFFLIHLKNAI